MLNKQLMNEVKSICDSFPHCGDYGKFYVNETGSSIFVVFGDADGCFEFDTQFGEKIDQLEELCLDNQIKFETEAEYGPPSNDKWILFSRGLEYSEDWADNTPDLTYYHMCPNLLTIEEYVHYHTFFNKLHAGYQGIIE